jgi:hypothetical protein
VAHWRELTRRNIPFVNFGGLKFLDAAHIKDLLALLRFVENPRDGLAGFRLMQLMPGVGPTSAQRVLDVSSPTPPCLPVPRAMNGELLSKPFGILVQAERDGPRTGARQVRTSP